MKRNEKILGGVLGLALVGYFIWKSVVPFFVEPVATLRADRDEMLSQVSDQQLKKYAADRADRRLSEARDRGLPGDSLDAQRLYQQWLTELALDSGLDVTVKPGVRRPVAGVYTGVQLNLEGTATFDELQTFLRRFRKTDLLHRVFRITLDSPASEGDPNLKVVLIAEGLNIEGTPKRGRLFPQIELIDTLSAEAEQLTVSKQDLKARPGDWLRIGNELVAVKSADDGRLQLTRGTDGTTAAEHAAGTRVELLPVRDTGKNEPPVAVAEIDSPFVKPRVYDPKFDGFADTKLVRGNTASMTVKVADYDRDAGKPKLELIDGPEGLSFDTSTGKLDWTPGEDVPAGPYEVTLAANVPAPQERLEQTIAITLTDPNTAPTLAALSREEVFLGERLEVPLQASDAESDSLGYEIEQAPDGATIDEETATFVWSVPDSFSPGEVEVTVVASDGGEPPMSAKQTFTVAVLENLKPFVHLSGTWLETSAADSAGGNVQKQAFLYDRSQNQWYRLREGRSFEAAGLTALVKEIASDSVTYVRNGEIWKIRVGANLGEAEKIGDEPVEAVLPLKERSPIEASRPAGELLRNRPAPSTAAADPKPPK